ncbi:MAG TPA: pitrilysin family protein [Kiritimatiellia bacterium]|nr:pitrilysin family protein [Kiritimatiellia bacterium]HMO97734.1 pitrilysin family protein [Kiritimatiellia bacterium]HMP95373.1 pitrilysin family protein [Kiritimatiellia bacterium]
MSLPAFTLAQNPDAPKSTLDHLRQLNQGLHRDVLDNGMVVLVKPDHSAPVVAVQIWIGTGSIHEGANLGAGLSHYMEHMIFKGTPNRGPADITREIDEAGGSINAYTAHDRTVFYADLPARNWKVGIDVLSDAVMNASLPEDEWEREKEVILREFAMGYDSPPRVHGKLLYETAYRVHPYRVPVIGYEDVFRTMTREHLERFFHEHYVPDNMTVVVVGDINPTETVAYIRETFANFNRRARAPVILPTEPAQLTPRFARATGAYNVSRMHWTYHTVSVDHPDAPALDILAGILGDGRSSLLNQELRENRHLVHTVSAWSHTPAHGGLFGISASFDPDKEHAVLQAVAEFIETYRTQPFTDEDIAKAKRNHVIAELGALQTMSGQASSYGAGEFYTGNPRFSEYYLEKIMQVDNDRLHEVFDRYIVRGFETVALLTPEPSAADTGKDSVAKEFPVSRITLPNGIPVVVREDRRLPFVFVSVALGGGLLSEDEQNNGITQLIADLLTRGTESRTGREIAEAIESRGASISGFSGRNSFGLNASGLAEDRELLMDVLADCLRHPNFPEDELLKQRRQQIASLRQQREQPMFLAQESLRNQLFPGHPYRMNTLGSEDVLSALTRDDLLAYYHRHLAPDNIAIAIFGDIDTEEAKRLAERHLGDLSGTSERANAWQPAAPQLPVEGEVRGPFEQAILLLGYPGIDIKDPRGEALNILQRALSGLSSELAIEVREKRGLVYFIGALAMSGLEPGLFAVYAGTTAAQMSDVKQISLEQLERIAREGLRPDELERARAQLIAGHDMNLQNTGDLAQLCALNELYGLGYAYTFSVPDRLQAVSGEDIRALAAEMLQPGRLAVTRLLPQ